MLNVQSHPPYARVAGLNGPAQQAVFRALTARRRGFDLVGGSVKATWTERAFSSTVGGDVSVPLGLLERALGAAGVRARPAARGGDLDGLLPNTLKAGDGSEGQLRRGCFLVRRRSAIPHRLLRLILQRPNQRVAVFVRNGSVARELTKFLAKRLKARWSRSDRQRHDGVYFVGDNIQITCSYLRRPEVAWPVLLLDSPTTFPLKHVEAAVRDLAVTGTGQTILAVDTAEGTGDAVQDLLLESLAGPVIREVNDAYKVFNLVIPVRDWGSIRHIVDAKRHQIWLNSDFNQTVAGVAGAVATADPTELPAKSRAGRVVRQALKERSSDEDVNPQTAEDGKPIQYAGTLVVVESAAHAEAVSLLLPTWTAQSRRSRYEPAEANKGHGGRITTAGALRQEATPNYPLVAITVNVPSLPSHVRPRTVIRLRTATKGRGRKGGETSQK